MKRKENKENAVKIYIWCKTEKKYNFQLVQIMLSLVFLWICLQL